MRSLLHCRERRNDVFSPSPTRKKKLCVHSFTAVPALLLSHGVGVTASPHGVVMLSHFRLSHVLLKWFCNVCDVC
ncbi:uncharacterized protein G2W53_014430 [Senna tora]|uniref:Uncharacterized protein n=1 Tax=Senna tora TaxID=362788 RepID=A0A835C817_9FABA|nr:uncharacterized protein G2W53_014430 [Senna tora]